MQRPWWSTAKELASHVLMYSAALTVLVLAAMYGSAIVALASHLIESQLVLHVLMFLEYALLIADAIFILAHVVQHIWESFRRILR